VLLRATAPNAAAAATPAAAAAATAPPDALTAAAAATTAAAAVAAAAAAAFSCLRRGEVLRHQAPRLLIRHKVGRRQRPPVERTTPARIHLPPRAPPAQRAMTGVAAGPEPHRVVAAQVEIESKI
jgi:hypothetical protein